MGECFRRGLPAGERRRGTRQVRVTRLCANFVLLEVRAIGCGPWREAVGYDALADQAPARPTRRRPSRTRTLPCGCVTPGCDVTLCSAGRDLWARASADLAPPTGSTCAGRLRDGPADAIFSAKQRGVPTHLSGSRRIVEGPWTGRQCSGGSRQSCGGAPGCDAPRGETARPGEGRLRAGPGRLSLPSSQSVCCRAPRNTRAAATGNPKAWIRKVAASRTCTRP